MKKGDVLLGAHFGRILYHIADLDKYFDNVDAIAFAKDKKLQDCARARIGAIGRELQILVERREYIAMDCGVLKEIRDAIAHDGNEMVEEFLWNTVKKNLPLLKKVICKISAENYAIKNASNVKQTEMREAWEARSDEWLERLRRSRE